MPTTFDMVVSAAECGTCERAVERGEIVRLRPVAATLSILQCAGCAAAELLPLLDAEHRAEPREAMAALAAAGVLLA